MLPGGIGFGSDASGGGGGSVEIAMSGWRLTRGGAAAHAGGVLWLRMSNELMSRELSKLKTVVGARARGARRDRRRRAGHAEEVEASRWRWRG